MKRHSRLLVASVMAIAAMALLASSATAASFSLSPAGEIELVSEGPLTLEPNIFGFGTLECEMTLSGSLHRGLIAKVDGALVGYVTEVQIGEEECNGGTGFTLSGRLPWHIQYEEISGELPSAVTSVEFRVMEIEFLIDGTSDCLWAGDIGASVDVTGSGPFTTDTSLELNEANQQWNRVTRLSGFLGCPTGATLEGSFSFPRQTLTRDGGGSPARLSATPTEVVIEALESSDTFSLRNTGGATATIDSIEDEAATQFDVTGCGEGSRIVVEASCVYTIEVDDRPLASGRVTVTYDDGEGGTGRVSVDVDIAGGEDAAVLRADPASVAIEALEQNDIVEIRNEGGGATATIDRVTVTTTDTESPEFTVTTTGCREALADNEACHYLISVNSRPEANGSITVEYDDGGGGGENRRLVIDVDVAGPDPAELEADPTEVIIESLESNDSFVIRNISPDTGAVINRAILTSDDTERPEFSVTGVGCPEIYVAGASCTYVVSVNSRPEADGRYAIEYDDGAGNDRTVTVNIDIAS